VGSIRSSASINASKRACSSIRAVYDTESELSIGKCVS
jgi:hypothetical protein